MNRLYFVSFPQSTGSGKPLPPRATETVSGGHAPGVADYVLSVVANILAWDNAADPLKTESIPGTAKLAIVSRLGGDPLAFLDIVPGTDSATFEKPEVPPGDLFFKSFVPGINEIWVTERPVDISNVARSQRFPDFVPFCRPLVVGEATSAEAVVDLFAAFRVRPENVRSLFTCD